MLFNEMIKNNLNITWDNTNGVIASCTEELMTAADAGCIGLTVGMESGNREILRKNQKTRNC